MKGQLHIHTTCSDGRLTPQEAADTYQRLGYAFIAITDHDHLLKPNYQKIIAQVQSDLIVFCGIELTIPTRWGYVHVNEIKGDKETLHIFNHPADYGLSIKQTLECIEDVSRHYHIDAFEISHLGFYSPEYDQDELPYPRVATDDSHNRMACGRAWIEMDYTQDKDSILSVIRKGGHKCCFARNSFQIDDVEKRKGR